MLFFSFLDGFFPMKAALSPGQPCAPIVAYGPPKDLLAKENFAKEGHVAGKKNVSVKRRGGKTKSDTPRCSHLQLLWNWERSPEVQAQMNNGCGEGFLFSFPWS